MNIKNLKPKITSLVLSIAIISCGTLKISTEVKADTVTKATTISQNKNVGIMDESSSAEELTKVEAKVGESYTFNNNDSESQYLDTNCSSSGRINLVIYQKDGQEYDSKLLDNPLSIYIPGGGKAVITVESVNEGYNTISFEGSSNLITYQVSSTSPLAMLSMKQGESYVFTNSDTISHFLQTNAFLNGKVNIEEYEKDGQEYDTYVLDNPDEIDVPAGGKTVVTVASVSDNYNTIEFAGYYNWIKYEKSNTPALTSVSLKLGQSYTFTNYDSNYGHIVVTNSESNGKIDVVGYAEDGSQLNSSLLISTDMIYVPVGGKVVIKVKSVNDNYETVDFGGGYNFFNKQADKMAPIVKSVGPKNGEINVGEYSRILIAFSELIQSSYKYNNIVLKDANGKVVPVKLSISDKVLTIQPKSVLSYNTKYTLFVPKGSIQDKSGNALINDYTTSFTTKKDTTPPTVYDMTAKTVGKNYSIVATFSKAIQQGNKYRNIVLKDPKGKVVSTTLSISDKVLTIKINGKLSYNVKYTLSMPKGAIKDKFGNVLDRDIISYYYLRKF